MRNALCLIGRQGTPRTNELLVETAESLRSLDAEVYMSYLAGDDINLTSYIQDTYGRARTRIITQREVDAAPGTRANRIISTTFRGLRETFYRAFADGFKAIGYSEGDKPTIAQDFHSFMHPIETGQANVTLATRSKEGWKAFPAMQRLVEGQTNKYLSTAAGLPTTMDFLYGPKGFDRQALERLKRYPYNGWETIIFPIVMTGLEGGRIVGVEVPGYPQQGYLEKYSLPMRNPAGQLAWRTLQCLPVRKAVKIATLLKDIRSR